MTGPDKTYLEQLDYVISIFDTYQRSPNSIIWDTSQVSHFNALAKAAINRIAGADSVYGKQVEVILRDRTHYSQQGLIGVVQALRDDIAHGYLTSLKEIVRGDLFSDFLDMADYLAKQDYKDAAAVIVGGVLESHLRQLCRKHDIDTEILLDMNIKPKKSEQLNSELAKKKVYDLLEQKSVTTWLDLRNKAAHARYQEYTKDQVTLMLQWMRMFIARYPA